MGKTSLPQAYGTWMTINRDCNLNCKWCYAKPQYTQNAGDMTVETAEKVIALSKGLPLERIILIGGEPTIHPQFIGFVKMINDQGLTPVTITNGIKFSDADFLHRAMDAGLRGITTSLKAHNDESYEQLTGQKVFKEVVKSIRNVVASGIDHSLSVTIGGDMFDSFDDMLSTICESGVKSFALDMERPVIINDETAFSENSAPQKMAEFFAKIYPKVSSCGVDFVMKISTPFCFFPEGFIQTLIEKKQIISGCHIYTGSGIIIDPSGNLLPCNHFCNNSLGLIGDDFVSAQDYLKFRARPDIVEFYETMSSFPCEKCSNCQYWQQCGGGCRMHWLHRKVL